MRIEKIYKFKIKMLVSFFKIMLILLILLVDIAYSQEENDGSWFFRDRAYPFDTIPGISYANAIQEQINLRQTEGYNPSSTGWMSIGPKPYTNYNFIPLAGRTVNVKYDTYDQTGNTVYILGHGGGVWKSTNFQSDPSQAVFSPMTNDLLTQSSGDIAIFHDASHNILYYGTGGSVMCFVYNYYGIGVYKTTNGGANWLGPFASGLPSLIYTSRILVNHGNEHVFLADCKNGLYRSNDGGEHWTQSISGPCTDVIISPSNSSKMYAVTSIGIG